MKRIYQKGHCRYCGESGHTKRNCEKRAADEVAAAAAAAGAAAVQPPAANGGEASVVPESPTEIQLEASQPPLSQIDDSQEVLPPPVRPPKLPPKRKSSKQEKATPGSSSQAATTQTAPTPPATTQPTTLPPSHPMQGASQGTVTRLFNFMKFVPNPGFRPPENKK
ncbi:branchpoint-bridging protein-like [Arachis ipaensis]|uniref:branchpoint-bridging protein-like n=1 Tax=Arachis ipaensis TaxID=130454 RepID=UPI000A2B84FB|nr:branchpoint-bridging protein-like [Arachis ipaensis]